MKIAASTIKEGIKCDQRVKTLSERIGLRHISRKNVMIIFTPFFQVIVIQKLACPRDLFNYFRSRFGCCFRSLLQTAHLVCWVELRTSRLRIRKFAACSRADNPTRKCFSIRDRLRTLLLAKGHWFLRWRGLLDALLYISSIANGF